MAVGSGNTLVAVPLQEYQPGRTIVSNLTGVSFSGHRLCDLSTVSYLITQHLCCRDLFR
jgi:hypothetical protein